MDKVPRPSTKPFKIDALRNLSVQGFSSSTLFVMEDQAMKEAARLLLLRGRVGFDDSALLDTAAHLLPQGDMLIQHYAETRTWMKNSSVQYMHTIVTTLADTASSLERSSARQIARERDGGIALNDSTQARTVLAKRYARVIEAAQELQEHDPQNANLYGLTTRPIGPLESIFDKAMAIVQDRKASAVDGLRQRQYG